MFEKFLEDIKSLNLPKGRFAIFGSSPIVVRGIRDVTHDVDIVVTQDVWEEYIRKDGWKVKPCGEDEYVEWEGHNIELWNNWRPGDWDIQKLIDEADEINGLPFVKLESVLRWKKIHNRPKDKSDAKLIENYLTQGQRGGDKDN